MFVRVCVCVCVCICACVFCVHLWTFVPLRACVRACVCVKFCIWKIRCFTQLSLQPKSKTKMTASVHWLEQNTQTVKHDSLWCAQQIKRATLSKTLFSFLFKTTNPQLFAPTGWTSMHCAHLVNMAIRFAVTAVIKRIMRKVKSRNKNHNYSSKAKQLTPSDCWFSANALGLIFN